MGVRDFVSHELVPSPWLPSLLLAIALAISPGLRHSLPRQIATQQSGIYSALAQVAATLLGFLLAGASLLAILPADRPLVKRLIAQGFVRRSVLQLGQASIAMAFLTASGILGLIVDIPPSHRGKLGLGSYWIWVVVLTAIPAVLLIARSILTLNRSVGLAAGDRPPGSD